VHAFTYQRSRGLTSVRPDKGAMVAAAAPPHLSVPSMNIDLEVEVLWGVGRNDPSKPQGADCEGSAESSGERDLRGDEQQPDTRQADSGRAG
jgi:hypothetical protein